MSRAGCGIGLVALVMSIAAANAQSATNMAALKGLAPISALSKTVDGTAALGANFTVTGAIQTGAIRQPTLMPFRGTAAASFARRLHHRRQFGSADRRLGHDFGRSIRGARALSRPGALHQHLQIRLGCDRLRQLDIAARIPTPENISSPTERPTAKNRLPTRLWPSSRISTAPRILFAGPMAGPRERPAPTFTATPARSRPSPRSCRSWGRTTSIFQPTIMSTTAARS